jgi:molybdate transport system substrate-binding protein
MNDAQPIRILSADAPKIGLRRCADTFAASTGQPFEIELATAPAIKERLASGIADADIVVVPLPVMEEFAMAGRVDPRSVAVIGSVTVGVVVRNGAREPDLTSVESFIRSLLAADAVVYNEASSGQYIARVLKNLGLADKVAAKSVVVRTGAAVMERLAAESSGDAVGFGHVTEIRLHDDLGTHLVGPLPRAIGRATPYAAGLLAAASRPVAARNLIDFMVSASGKEIFVATGVL